MALAKLGAKVKAITIWAHEFKIERVNEMKRREAAAWGHSKIRGRNLKIKRTTYRQRVKIQSWCMAAAAACNFQVESIMCIYNAKLAFCSSSPKFYSLVGRASINLQANPPIYLSLSPLIFMYTHPLEEWRGIVLKWSIRDQTPLSPWILSSSLSFLFFKFHRSRHARAKGPSILVDQVKSSRKLTFWNSRGGKRSLAPSAGE